MILKLTRVGNSEFKDPAALVKSPEQTRSIPVVLIRPEPEHHAAYKESGNPVEAFLTEFGMGIAIRPFFVLACIWTELVRRRVELVLGVRAIRHAR